MMYVSRNEVGVRDLFQAVLAQDLPTIKKALQEGIDPSDTSIIGIILEKAVQHAFSAELLIEVKANIEQICAILKKEAMEIQEEKKDMLMSEGEFDEVTTSLLSQLQEVKPGTPATQEAIGWAEILQLSLSIMQNKQPGQMETESIGDLFAVQKQMFPSSGEEIETDLADAKAMDWSGPDAEEDQNALEIDRNFQIMGLHEQLADLEEEIRSCCYRKANGKKGIYPDKMELLITSLEEKGRLAEELEALESNKAVQPKRVAERTVRFSEVSQMCIFAKLNKGLQEAEYREMPIKI